MKILHTADVHLDYRQYGIQSRKIDFMECFSRICEIAIREKVDALVLAGDTLDSRKPDGDTIEFLKNRVAMTTAAGVKVLGIHGNHDPGSSWMNVCGITDLTDNPVKLGNKVIAGQGYMDPPKLLDKLYTLKDTVKADLFVVHQAFKELDGGFGRHVLSLKDISPFMQEMGVKYVAMGDIHQKGDAYVDGVLFAYPGSPESKSSDDDGEKTVNLVDFTGNTPILTQIPTQSRRVINLALMTKEDYDLFMEARFDVAGDDGSRPIFHIKYSSDLEDDISRLENELSTMGCIVRGQPISETMAIEGGIVTPELYQGDSTGILQDVLDLFFKEGSDEHKLIIGLMDGADVNDTVTNYVKHKPE